MVRPSGAVLTYLPEPPGWRAHPPGRLPADTPDPCWSLDPAPPAKGSRPLAIVEVVDYDLSALGTSRIIKLDPVGVLAERLGDAAVQCVRRALRDSWTYPSLATAGNALLKAIFGEPGPSSWLFEVIVSPHVYASRTLWNERLLGRRKLLATYRKREFELDTSPDLACCNMDVLHPVSRPSPDARRHWTVRICQITPLVKRELSDREAEAALQQLLDKARRRRRHQTLPLLLSECLACGCRPLRRSRTLASSSSARGGGVAATRQRRRPRGSAAILGPSPPNHAKSCLARRSCRLGTSCFCARTGCPWVRAHTSHTSSSPRRGPSGGSAAAAHDATSASSPSRRASPSSSRRGR